MFKQRAHLPADELRDLYLREGRTISELARYYGISETSIRRKLDDLGITIRSRGPKSLVHSTLATLTENELRELYSERKLSIPQIAELYGCANESIRLRLIKYNIPIRSFSESTRVQYGTHDEYKDFDGNDSKKAYLLGFRLGDLNVRQQHPSGGVIRISGSSSRMEQVNLIQSLFQPYGHVKVSRRLQLAYNGLIQYSVTCSVNETFNFLIDYISELPNWILKNDQVFLAFFGGFVDAEGSFHLKKTTGTIQHGRFSLKNTDLRLLEQCHARLISLGIQCSSITKSYEAGRQTSKRGIFANFALWEFNIEGKESLRRFIQIVSPFVLHEKRRADMERVRENIEWRNSDEFQREAAHKRIEATRATNEAKKKNRN